MSQRTIAGVIAERLLSAVPPVIGRPVEIDGEMSPVDEGTPAVFYIDLTGPDVLQVSVRRVTDPAILAIISGR